MTDTCFVRRQAHQAYLASLAWEMVADERIELYNNGLMRAA